MDLFVPTVGLRLGVLYPFDNDESFAVNTTPGKLPRAILPPQRTFWGAILDVIVGDGPSKR